MNEQAIFHPTDLSDFSHDAFAHALRIALALRCQLYIVHIAETDAPDEHEGLPRVRRTLAQWQLMKETDPPEAVAETLGVKVSKVGLEPQNTLRGLARFIDAHPGNLIVLSTHGREGLAHWALGSMAEDLMQRVCLPTLFLPRSARGFVDQRTGKLHLRRVLVPVDHAPAPASALTAIHDLLAPLGGPKTDLLHVGERAPVIRRVKDNTPVAVDRAQGDVVETILQTASRRSADLIAMPTAGQHGFLDALRGSTTERVLRRAPCPVLAMPAR